METIATIAAVLAASLARVQAAVAASGEPLTVCAALADENLLGLSLDEIVARGKAALDELTGRVRAA